MRRVSPELFGIDHLLRFHPELPTAAREQLVAVAIGLCGRSEPRPWSTVVETEDQGPRLAARGVLDALQCDAVALVRDQEFVEVADA